MPAAPALGNPRRLTRLLEHIAAGNRRPRGLAHALDVEVGVVHDYLLAASFLGLVRLEPECHLSRDGLAYVYAGSKRARVLAAIVSRHPRLAPLSGATMGRELWAGLAKAEWPDLGEGAARRQGAALRRLLEPVWRRKARPPGPEQLALSFSTDVAHRQTAVDLRSGLDENPDVYLVLLRALLDHGELSPARMRALLDSVGARDCGIGGYVAMATRRGDVRRVGETLVVTPAAVQRRALADSVVGVALSDPDFRAHVEAKLAGRPGDDRRFGPWVRRLFGDAPLAEALDRVLFGRSLAGVPVATSAGEPWAAVPGAWITNLDKPGAAWAFPRALAALGSGLSGVNRALRAGGASPLTVCLPSAIDPRVSVHGGLLSPGEVPPRVVADLVSLRLRAIRSAPAVGCLVAAAAVDRRGALRLHIHGNVLMVEVKGHPAREFTHVVEGVCARHAITPVWGPEGPEWVPIVDALVELGLLLRLDELVLLEEGLFMRMQSDPEHRVVWEELQPLIEWIEAGANPGLGR